jgi:hypothetical protein
VILARTLWLQGYPAQAAEHARAAVRDAERMDHPVTLSVATLWAITVYLWIGDLDRAEALAARFTARAGSHSLGPYLAVGQAFAGAIAIRRGDAEAGIGALRGGLATLREARHEVLTTALELVLAEGLAATGREAEGLALVDATIRRVEAHGDLIYRSELLRVKGLALMAMQQEADAEASLRQSLDQARAHSAPAWELRTATDLAALLAGQGRSGEAAALLRPVADGFTEGAETADLQAAARLLAMLG